MNHRKWFPESFRITPERLGVDLNEVERERERERLEETLGLFEGLEIADDTAVGSRIRRRRERLEDSDGEGEWVVV